MDVKKDFGAPDFQSLPYSDRDATISVLSVATVLLETAAGAALSRQNRLVRVSGLVPAALGGACLLAAAHEFFRVSDGSTS